MTRKLIVMMMMMTKITIKNQDLLEASKAFRDIKKVSLRTY